MEPLLAFARGPLFIACFSFMVLGLLRHLAVTAWEARRILKEAGDKKVPWKAVARASAAWLFPIGKIKNQLIFSLSSILFHVAILVAPVFLAGHVVLWERGTGLSWPTISNPAADVLTLLAIALALLLVLQRLLARATRALSRFQDYVLPPLIAVPFASGFFLMHPAVNPFSFEATFLVHLLSANLIFVLIPLTKLSHAALMPSLQLVGELGWRWPSDAGTRVAQLLHKEEEPV